MQRNWTIYNTIGNNQSTGTTNAVTWGDLQTELSARGISHAGMKVVVGETQNSLESSAASLPTSDFTLFFMPQKVKSGYGDDSLIDWEDGVTWDEVSWEDGDNVPEDYSFKTKRDLTIARAKKAQAYLQGVINYLISDEHKTEDDPQVSDLRKTAEQIQKNLGLFD